MTELGKQVLSTDLINRGFGDEFEDFLQSERFWSGDIITNPPYKFAQEFVEKSIDLVADGRKIAMFLKLTFLEGQKRRLFFEKYPPKTIYVYSKRKNCAKNGNFDSYDSSAVAYAWYIWEKGFTGEPVIRWI